MPYVSHFNVDGQTIDIKDADARESVEALEEESTRYARNRLTGVKILCIGDSFLRGTGGTVGRGWGYYLAENTGADCKIYQNAGGGFIDGGGETSDYTGETFVDIIQHVVNDFTSAERNEFEWVVCAGGWNDGRDASYNESTLTSAISSFCQTCRTYFPRARIALIPLKGTAAMTSDNRVKAYDVWVREGMAQGVYTSISPMDWFTGRDSYDAGDSIHLNDAGYALCGQYIASMLYGTGFPSYQQICSGSVSYVGNAEEASSQRFRVNRYGNLVVVQGAVRVTSWTAGADIVSMPSTFCPWGRTTVVCGCGDGTALLVDFYESGIKISDFATSLPSSATNVYFCHTFWVRQ